MTEKTTATVTGECLLNGNVLTVASFCISKSYFLLQSHAISYNNCVVTVYFSMRCSKNVKEYLQRCGPAAVSQTGQRFFSG